MENRPPLRVGIGGPVGSGKTAPRPGTKIPRKGGPGITRSDFLVINKIDLAPHVGAWLERSWAATRRMRGERRFVFSNLKTAGDFVVRAGLLE